MPIDVEFEVRGENEGVLYDVEVKMGWSTGSKGDITKFEGLCKGNLTISAKQRDACKGKPK